MFADFARSRAVALEPPDVSDADYKGRRRRNALSGASRVADRGLLDNCAGQNWTVACQLDTWRVSQHRVSVSTADREVADVLVKAGLTIADRPARVDLAVTEPVAQEQISHEHYEREDEKRIIAARVKAATAQLADERDEAVEAANALWCIADDLDVMTSDRDALAKKIAAVKAVLDEYDRDPSCRSALFTTERALRERIGNALGGTVADEPTVAPCVYGDLGKERPLLTLPGIYRRAFGAGIPPKRWCWTHETWEDYPSPPPSVADEPLSEPHEGTRVRITLHEVVEVNETDTDGPAAFRAYGETDDGLRVGFTVTVSDVEEVDW